MNVCEGDPLNVRTSTLFCDATSAVVAFGFTSVDTEQVAALEQPIFTTTMWL